MTSADKSRAIALWLNTQPPSVRARFMDGSRTDSELWSSMSVEQRQAANDLLSRERLTATSRKAAATPARPRTFRTPDRIIHIKGDTYTIVPQTPVVNVQVAPAPAPIVNVAAAPAPVVNVTTPDVTVNVPEAKATLPQDIRIISMPERTISQVVVRDPQGRVAGLETAAE